MKTVAIAGLGAVGLTCAERLDQGMDGLTLTAVSARNLASGPSRVAHLRSAPAVVPVELLPDYADVIVECAPASAFSSIATPCLEAGKTLVTISVGALLDHPELVTLARRTGGRISVPSGALLGLDAVQAAQLGTIHSVRMVTTKPPGGLAGAPHLATLDVDLATLTAPLCVFSGTAREGAAAFPANVNVAAALGLAGLGPDHTFLEVWADPAAKRNRHQIIVESDSARMELIIENVPSVQNPRTGKIVANSVLASLQKMVSPLVIGT
jgi:aspartate dehydrogenase